jgi:hypothetical protein
MSIISMRLFIIKKLLLVYRKDDLINTGNSPDELIFGILAQFYLFYVSFYLLQMLRHHLFCHFILVNKTYLFC